MRQERTSEDYVSTLFFFYENQLPFKEYIIFSKLLRDFTIQYSKQHATLSSDLSQIYSVADKMNQLATIISSANSACYILNSDEIRELNLLPSILDKISICVASVLFNKGIASDQNQSRLVNSAVHSYISAYKTLSTACEGTLYAFSSQIPVLEIPHQASEFYSSQNIRVISILCIFI